MNKYKDLVVWNKTRVLIKKIYLLTSDFPNSEKYNLTDQIRRAAVSILANISEGAGRGSDKDFSRFLDIANGSLYELESLLIIAEDLEYFKPEAELLDEIDHIQKMIYKLKLSLNK